MDNAKAEKVFKRIEVVVSVKQRSSISIFVRTGGKTHDV